VDSIAKNADVVQQYVAAFGIPILLILLSALAEKLTKGQGWRWQYFYLGVDLTLAALSTALVNLADIQVSGKAAPAGAGAKSAMFIAGALFLLFIVMCLHQDYGHSENPSMREIVLLVFASNLAATGVFFGFILMKFRGLL
jgi:hypothetical protein